MIKGTLKSTTEALVEPKNLLRQKVEKIMEFK
jgi:hypothetical protein